jgi:tetratricopeptide (TPR) repeat protein
VSAGRLRLSAALLLSGACLLSYANGLTGAFAYDDKAIVRDNPRIRSPERIDEVLTTQYFGGKQGTGTAYRPALLLSYAVQWWVHGGNPVAYHAVNLLFHVLVTLLYARLLLRIDLPTPVAIGSALLFAVHPIHVEAVTSVVGRGETQAAALVLGFLLLSLRFVDRAGWRGLALGAALVLFLLANLTKESAAVAPALLFLLLAWRGDGSFAARLGAALRRGMPVYAGAAAVLLAVFRLRFLVLGGAIKASGTGIFEVENPLAPLTPLSRAANACAIFLRYLGRMALPLRLSSDESAWSIPVLSPRDILFWAAPVLLAALVVASLARLRFRSAAALGFLFLCVAALPASNLLFPTGTIFAERLAYLPSAGFCLIAASWIVGRTPDFAALSRRRAGALAVLALIFAVRAIVRNPVWASDAALFTNMVRVSPASAKAHYDFAYMSAEAGNARLALEHYTRATEIYPGYWDAWAGKGRSQMTLGDLGASERSYAESLRLVPTYENGWFGVGLAREETGNRAGAGEAYRQGLHHNPQSLPLAYRMALLLGAERRPATLHAWRRALAIDPGSLPSRLGFADWLAASGLREDAIAQVREALRLAPRYKPALEKLKELQPSGPPR